VNNRLGKVSEVLNNESVGDYLTPEQRIGQLNMNEPWESCITICQQWAWKPNDQMKSLKECIQTLAKTAAGNGNLLFNVGPMMDGRMEGRQVARLKGNRRLWMKTYGSTIYGTKGGPFAPNDNFATTRKGNKIYICTCSKPLTVYVTIPAMPGVVIN
jgi:alpha-L-fucosidase